MMATVPHVTSSLELRKFQADGFLLTRVYVSTVLASLSIGTCHIWYIGQKTENTFFTQYFYQYGLITV